MNLDQAEKEYNVNVSCVKILPSMRGLLMKRLRVPFMLSQKAV